ncbi:unnamed protein product [Paramecium primaurelia]|uniref:Transmembrane protein n=1 Tax=Paramecium primaurelia TaxID=5886 RepID=A0A8S1P7D1_PARPR|nr:unnamed protein product [Paramecium primaurelia]
MQFLIQKKNLQEWEQDKIFNLYHLKILFQILLSYWLLFLKFFIRQQYFVSFNSQFDIFSNRNLFQQDFKQINFNKFNSKFCALNQQETMIILSKNKYQQFDLVEQKLVLIELETQKVISCFEEVLDQKFKCIDSFSLTMNQILLQVIQIQELNYGILNLVNSSLSLKRILQEQICLQFQVEQYQFKIVIISQSYGIQKPQNSNNLKWMVILILLIKYVFLRWFPNGNRIIDFHPYFLIHLNNQYFIAKGEQEFFHIWKFNTKYITEFHNKYLCQPIWQQQFSLYQNLLIWQIDNSKIFILNLEKISKQKQLPFQSDSKIQSRTIILSTNLLIRSNPFEFISINNKLELKNEQIVGYQLIKQGKLHFVLFHQCWLYMVNHILLISGQLKKNKNSQFIFQ